MVVGPLQAQGADGRGHRVDAEGAANGHLVANTLTAGAHSDGVRPPGRRAEDDVNLVALLEDGTETAGTLTSTNGQLDDQDTRRLIAEAGPSPLVRRLTPLECERLQGWPDGWTAPDGVDAPDSRRYAAAGDGVASPVAEWIGRRIIAVDAGEL